MKINDKYPAKIIHVIKQIIVLAIITTITFGTGFLVVKADKAFTDFEKSKIERKMKEINDLQVKNLEEERHERLLDCIGFLESTNKNTVILDSNNKYSYGKYQLQRETIQDFYKRYKGIEITLKEAEEIAMNGIQSRELIKSMIVDYGLIDKWWNTKNKIIEGRCVNFEADEINLYLR